MVQRIRGGVGQSGLLGGGGAFFIPLLILTPKWLASFCASLFGGLFWVGWVVFGFGFVAMVVGWLLNVGSPL